MMSKATELLVAYGYEETPAGYERTKNGRPKDRFVSVSGGFEYFVRDDGQWVKQHFQVLPSWAGIAGLTQEEHPECFDYTFPEDWVATEYANAVANREAWAAEAVARKAGA